MTITLSLSSHIHLSPNPVVYALPLSSLVPISLPTMSSAQEEFVDGITIDGTSAPLCREKETDEYFTAAGTSNICSGASNVAHTTIISSPQKCQKKPSGCLTGTPSSTQRPFKMRQSTLAKDRNIDFLVHDTPVKMASTEANALELERMFSEMLGGSQLEYSAPSIKKDNNANSAGSMPTSAAAHAGLLLTQTAESFYMSITDEARHWNNHHCTE